MENTVYIRLPVLPHTTQIHSLRRAPLAVQPPSICQPPISHASIHAKVVSGWEWEWCAKIGQ